MEVEHLLGPKLMFADIQRRTKWYASKAKPLPVYTLTVRQFVSNAKEIQKFII